MVADLAFVVGLAAIVAGVAFIYWPAALVVGGALAVASAFLLERRTP